LSEFCHILASWLIAAVQRQGACMLNSMTGYASRQGETRRDTCRITWEWDLRAVNGRGLDMRVRLPEGLGFLEKPLREAIASHVARGNVTLALRLREDRADALFPVDDAALTDLFQALKQVRSRAAAMGYDLRAPTSLGLLTARGLHAKGHDRATIDPAELGMLLLADFETVLGAFCAARASEGAAQAVKADLAEDLDRAGGAVCKCTRAVGRRRAGRATVGLPDAGIQPRGQHALFQGAAYGVDAPRPGVEKRDRSIARANSEPGVNA
jgi:uncharacterized protein (TIGR00255 family)